GHRLGDRLAVGHRTLTPRTQVRILVPQPHLKRRAKGPPLSLCARQGAKARTTTPKVGRMLSKRIVKAEVWEGRGGSPAPYSIQPIPIVRTPSFSPTRSTSAPRWAKIPTVTTPGIWLKRVSTSRGFAIFR